MTAHSVEIDSKKGDEVEWSAEPLPEDVNVGLRISRRHRDSPQVDGETETDNGEAPKEIECKVEKKKHRQMYF